MDRDCKGLWLPVRRKEKGILMRKNYIRLFFSIISIVIIVMIAEILVFVVSSVIIDKKWKERIFEQYMISFSNRVAEMGNEMTSYDLFASLMEMAPDRISGVILRDKDGHVVLSMGRTSRGEYIPQVTRDTVSGSEFRTDNMRVPDEFSISVNSSQNVERESVQKPQVVYLFCIHPVPSCCTPFHSDLRVYRQQKQQQIDQRSEQCAFFPCKW